MSVRVVIADDQELIRTGFRLILAAEPDIEAAARPQRATRPSRSLTSCTPMWC